MIWMSSNENSTEVVDVSSNQSINPQIVTKRNEIKVDVGKLNLDLPEVIDTGFLLDNEGNFNFKKIIPFLEKEETCEKLLKMIVQQGKWSSYIIEIISIIPININKDFLKKWLEEIIISFQISALDFMDIQKEVCKKWLLTYKEMVEL